VNVLNGTPDLTGSWTDPNGVGTNGAFVAANSPFEIGSPGTIAAVPEPETFVMMGLGLGLIGFMTKRRKQK
jgi:hypothetical protein